MTERAAAGSGTVFKDKHANRYIGQISIDGRRHRVYGSTKTHARTALNAIIEHGGTPPPNTARTTSRGQPLVNKGETLGALLDVWVKRDLEGRAIAPSTLAAHRWAVAHILATRSPSAAALSHGAPRRRHVRPARDHLRPVPRVAPQSAVDAQSGA